MLQSVAPGSPPDDPVRGLGPCSTPPRMLQSGPSFCRILSVASDAPVRGTGFTPGRSSPGASAVLHSAPVAPIRGVFLSYSLRCLGCSSPWHLGFTPGRSSPGASAVLHSAPVAPFRGVFFTYSLCCLGCSSPWHRVLPRTIQSWGLGRAPLRPRCSNPGRLFVVFSPLPQTLQSVAPGSPPGDQGSNLHRALQPRQVTAWADIKVKPWRGRPRAVSGFQRPSFCRWQPGLHGQDQCADGACRTHPRVVVWGEEGKYDGASPDRRGNQKVRRESVTTLLKGRGPQLQDEIRLRQSDIRERLHHRGQLGKFCDDGTSEGNKLVRETKRDREPV